MGTISKSRQAVMTLKPKTVLLITFKHEDY